MGLFPMMHPPGYPMVPAPFRPSNAPRRITDDRILHVWIPGISVPSALVQSRYRSWSFHQVTAPRLCRISSIQNTSDIFGQASSTLTPL